MSFIERPLLQFRCCWSDWQAGGRQQLNITLAASCRVASLLPVSAARNEESGTPSDKISRRSVCGGRSARAVGGSRWSEIESRRDRARRVQLPSVHAARLRRLTAGLTFWTIARLQRPRARLAFQKSPNVGRCHSSRSACFVAAPATTSPHVVECSLTDADWPRCTHAFYVAGRAALWRRRRRREATLIVCDATENDRTANNGNGESRSAAAETSD